MYLYVVPRLGYYIAEVPHHGGIHHYRYVDIFIHRRRGVALRVGLRDGIDGGREIEAVESARVGHGRIAVRNLDRGVRYALLPAVHHAVLVLVLEDVSLDRSVDLAAEISEVDDNRVVIRDDRRLGRVGGRRRVPVRIGLDDGVETLLGDERVFTLLVGLHLRSVVERDEHVRYALLGRGHDPILVGILEDLAHDDAYGVRRTVAEIDDLRLSCGDGYRHEVGRRRVVSGGIDLLDRIIARGEREEVSSEVIGLHALVLPAESHLDVEYPRLVRIHAPVAVGVVVDDAADHRARQRYVPHRHLGGHLDTEESTVRLVPLVVDVRLAEGGHLDPPDVIQLVDGHGAQGEDLARLEHSAAVAVAPEDIGRRRIVVVIQIVLEQGLRYDPGGRQIGAPYEREVGCPHHVRSAAPVETVGEHLQDEEIQVVQIDLFGIIAAVGRRDRPVQTGIEREKYRFGVRIVVLARHVERRAGRRDLIGRATAVERYERGVAVDDPPVVYIGVDDQLVRLGVYDRVLPPEVIGMGSRLPQMIGYEIECDTRILLRLRIFLRLGRTPLEEHEETGERDENEP